MAKVSRDQLNSERLQFLKINKNDFQFELNGDKFPAIRGYLTGFSTHTYMFEGIEQKKFDIYIKDESGEYQISFGMHTYTNLGLLNCLKSIEDITKSGLLTLISDKDVKIAKHSVKLEWNYTPLKWKFGFEDLKLNIEDKAKKNKLKDKIIDKWVADFLEAKPYTPEPVVNANGNGNSNGSVPGFEAVDDDDDEAPQW